MMLSGGDVMQYEAIKRGSIGAYLTKLNNFVEEIEREKKANQATAAQARARNR